ncbi:anti-sigma factor [Microbacterium sp. P06]|uniref:anti-sigma factor n=1 Tax=unclassified Microbacterium TaxID=2609290 RepID=UPI0037463388
MTHIDRELLALIALGEPVETPDESAHLADCAECADDLAGLRHAARAGRAGLGVGELESPDPAVWERISAELSLGADAPVTESRPRRRRSRPWGWALAAAMVLVAGIGVGVWALTARVLPTEVAEASLIAFPAHPGAEGSAVVEEQPDGSRTVRVQMTADAAPDTYREVWLIAPDASELVSLGVLDGDGGVLTVPAGVDLAEFSLVDVSQEAVDGDPNHSGDSIVRGSLSFP